MFEVIKQYIYGRIITDRVVKTVSNKEEAISLVRYYRRLYGNQLCYYREV